MRFVAFALLLASAALARGATAPAWGAAKFTLGAEGDSLFKVAAPAAAVAQDEGPDAVDVLRAIAAGALSAGTNATPATTNAVPLTKDEGRGTEDEELGADGAVPAPSRPGGADLQAAPPFSQATKTPTTGTK